MIRGMYANMKNNTVKKEKGSRRYRYDRQAEKQSRFSSFFCLDSLRYAGFSLFFRTNQNILAETAVV